MIVSWNWLTDYLRLDMPVDVLTERLALTGLNHESTTDVGGDLAIDLEVTSNRSDCLGHLGVAREIAVLFDRPLRIPAAAAARPRAPAVEAAHGRGGRGRRPLPAVHGPGRLGSPRRARAPGGCGSGWRRWASGRSATSST